MLYLANMDTELGRIVLASEDDALCGLWFAGAKYFGSTLRKDAQFDPEAPALRRTNEWLCRYFAGEQPSPDALKIRLTGSEFRIAVLRELLKIPYGQTTTYGTIADTLSQRSGKRVSAQAVGGAVGHNPISIIIPCHRVIGANGSLTGYAGGIEKKRRLLRFEATGSIT